MKYLPFPMTTKPLGMKYWHLGAFGTKLRTWSTYKEWFYSSYAGKIGLRYADPKGGGNVFRTHLKSHEVDNTLERWKRQGKDLSRVTFCEEAPDHELIVNGELFDDWTFFHSHIKKPMRAALREGGHYSYGLETRLLLQGTMTPSSWADLQALFECYPDHVIELSVYNCCLGQYRGRNTIIWEVRKY